MRSCIAPTPTVFGCGRWIRIRILQIRNLQQPALTYFICPEHKIRLGRIHHRRHLIRSIGASDCIFHNQLDIILSTKRETMTCRSHISPRITILPIIDIPQRSTPTNCRVYTGIHDIKAVIFIALGSFSKSKLRNGMTFHPNHNRLGIQTTLRRNHNQLHGLISHR